MTRMNGLTGVVVSSIAVLVVVIAGWVLFVSPQRAKADKLGVQVAAAKSELLGDEQLLASREAAEHARLRTRRQAGAARPGSQSRRSCAS